MAAIDFSGVNSTVSGDPRYRAALAGQEIPGFEQDPVLSQMPRGGAFDTERARYVANLIANGGSYNPLSTAGQGAINDNGEFYDPNADHWYSNPAFWGPVAVGAASLGLGLLGSGAGASTAGLGGVSAPSAGASQGISGLVPSWSAVPTSTAMTAVPSAAGGGSGMGFFSSLGDFLGTPGGQVASNVGGKIAGSLIDAHAAGNAANVQAQAAQNALDFAKGAYASDLTDFGPYRAAGSDAIKNLQGMGEFVAPDASTVSSDPGYQFARDEGLAALSRRAASGGNLLTSGADTERQKYASGLAAQYYNDAYNRARGTYDSNANRQLGIASLARSSRPQVAY